MTHQRPVVEDRSQARRRAALVGVAHQPAGRILKHAGDAGQVRHLVTAGNPPDDRLQALPQRLFTGFRAARLLALQGHRHLAGIGGEHGRGAKKPDNQG